MPIINPNLPLEITSKYSVLNNAFKLDKIKNAELDTYKNEPKDEINIFVGDDKVPDTFIPQVKLERWSNEVNFSVRLIDNEVGQETVNTLADKIVWEKGNKRIEFYDFAEGEGGYKLVWFLKKKPKTNVVSFTIQSKNLNFYYQPPLTQEFVSGYSEEFKKEIIVTETDVKDLEGNVLVHRPIEVVGSYVFYHQTKGGMVDKKGKAYGTGQGGIIYRPHIIDANGAETWGILHIENGIYSVEIPQEFLDNAVYPIKSNDTIGYTTLGGAGYIGIAGTTSDTSRTVGVAYTLSGAGTLTQMAIGVYSAIVATEYIDIWTALYNEDSAGTDSHDLVTSNEILNETVTKTKAFHYISFSSISLNADTYILAGLGNGEDMATANNTVYILYNSGGSTRTYYEETYGAGSYAARKAENPWTETDDSGAVLLSIYATYTAGGGAVSPNHLMHLMGCGNG